LSAQTEILGSKPDTPRSITEITSRRITLIVAGWLVGLSAAAWFLTVRQASSMSDMVSGLGQVGARAANDMTVPLFLGMWVGMMVAMMFPTVLPMVLAHRMVVRQRGEGRWPTAAFVLGYISIWSVIGVVPLVAFLAFRNLAADAGDSRWLPTLAGVVLVVAGTYQFTAWKAVCLKACRSPITFLLTHDFGGGARSGYRAGLSHGLYCLGCCWALMAVLVVVGLMNLVWMGLITLVFLAEKNWRHGVALTKLVGSALIALGVAVIVSPGLLGDLSGAATPIRGEMGPGMGGMSGS
jgi:predicted metal-binding membrane protein